MRASLVIAATVIVLAGSASAENLIPYQDPAAVIEGALLYADNCAACHGANLEGEADWQVTKDNGMRAAPPHDETGHTWHHADALLFDLTKRGVAEVVGTGYESDMIGYGDILSDQEILATLAYIKSTWPPRVIETHNKINASQ